MRSLVPLAFEAPSWMLVLGDARRPEWEEGPGGTWPCGQSPERKPAAPGSQQHFASQLPKGKLADYLKQMEWGIWAKYIKFFLLAKLLFFLSPPSHLK